MSAGLDAALDVPPTAERPRWDAEAQVLLGGRCRACATEAWPMRAVCWRCGAAEVQQSPLAARGVLETWSCVWIAAEGLEPPYIVGIVRLGADVRVFAHVHRLDERRAAPLEVVTRIDERSFPPFWFEPAS